MIKKAKPTKEQFALAEKLGISIDNDSQQVAAARLMDAVSLAIGMREGEVPPTENQINFADELGIDVRLDSKRISRAKIAEKLNENSFLAIIKMNLQPGDIVYLRDDYEMSDCEKGIHPRKYIISSIQSNGRVWFKGGNGTGAWASQIVKVNIFANQSVKVDV